MNRQFDELRGHLDRQFDKAAATLLLIQQDLTRFSRVQSAHGVTLTILKETLK